MRTFKTLLVENHDFFCEKQDVATNEDRVPNIGFLDKILRIGTIIIKYFQKKRSKFQNFYLFEGHNVLKKLGAANYKGKFSTTCRVDLSYGIKFDRIDIEKKGKETTVNKSDN